MNINHGKWVENILVTPGAREFMTVYDDGVLEIRGKGWGRKKKNVPEALADRVRRCNLGDAMTARNVAELLAEQLYEERKNK